jgi:hypothetical protein
MNGSRFLSDANIILYVPAANKINYTLKISPLIIEASSGSPGIPLDTFVSAFKVISELQLDFYNK